MTSVSIHCIYCCVKTARRCVCISFYTWDLHKTAYRVACKSEVVFETHFSSILYLCGTASHELGRSSCRHRTGDADLSLTAYLRTGY